jgi:hypothetical protein
MSLDVPPSLIYAAHNGDVPDEEFVACVRDSLPYAWSVVTGLADDLSANDRGFVDHAVPPPGETERGQLLRALASDAIRGALERHLGFTLAFQNCHRVAAIAPAAVGGPDHQAFVSPRGQLLNQDAALRDC